MSDDENAELVHDWESDCYVLRDEITRLRAELTAVTEERDMMRERCANVAEGNYERLEPASQESAHYKNGRLAAAAAIRSGSGSVK